MSDNRCKNERECTQEPWCRINGECHRAAAPLAAPLVAPGWKLVPLAPTADMVRAGNARYKCGLLVVQRTYADMLAATPPAPLQGQSAALPSDEREAFEAWAKREGFVEYTRKTLRPEQYQDTAVEIRWQAWQARSRLPLPAPAGVEGGEKHDSGHPAVNDSPMASPAPLQEPCALDRPELPVRPT